MFIVSGFGITGGAHRLWTHRAYKAKLPLKLLLMMCFASAGQNSIKQWVRDHRTHHKCSDTDADPHNSKRGFFFSHIGWLVTKKNNQVLQAGKKIDMSDIENDQLLQIFNKYFNYFKLVFCYIVPLTVVIWLYGENWRCAVAWHCIKFLFVLHCELTANSLAHAYGYRPYNKNIIATENRFVATCTFGEGWHNYHHAFPFDYKAAEHFDFFNWSTRFIQFFQKIGWAYDLRQATPEMINSIANRLGDGTPVHFPIGENLKKLE
ncbi:acyl-CoA Delta(11) desaturase-like isoform X2 [Plodia interpunctella]|nr:acyl-CoA Delta(11) desaturase-like isoform X2 [Plodia interpunctella]XP_053611885.1 acyl-CoA Delta(11) desaturase-like isoform X2 [Plodia interpunctella]